LLSHAAKDFASRAAKSFGIGLAALRKFWNCAVFGSTTERKFWKCDKSTVFYSAVQRTVSDLRPKALYFVQPYRKIVELRTKRTEKFLNREQSFCFVQLRSENFGIATNSTVFCSAGRPKALHLFSQDFEL
jgi:hypothetical protein